MSATNTERIEILKKENEELRDKLRICGYRAGRALHEKESLEKECEESEELPSYYSLYTDEILKHIKYIKHITKEYK